jgi:hypothetical protein
LQPRFLLDAFSSATDAFLANLAYVGIASLTCLALFVSYFGELYHDEFTLTTVFSVELHNSMCGSSTATEKIEN